MKITNTLTGKKETFRPLKGKKVKLFVCGPTVYDYSHIGHAKTYTAFDMIAKYLRYRGYDIFYLMNITDVDDKIIARAKQNNKDPVEVAREFEKEFMVDMNLIGNTAVNQFARASEHMPEIIQQIERLIKKGYAYVTSTGIYFDISKFKKYGKLSHQDQDALGQHRIEPDQTKKNPHDFSLWKFHKPGEIYWDSPWGKGRPGWHIEDTAITEKHLGQQYDIHGGALDLIFPHHECEIAQMESLSKKDLVKYWMHGGFLTVNGEKMSKSLGNFTTIRDILKKISPEALRLFLLRTNYGSPIDFTDNAIDDVKEAHKRLVNVYHRVGMEGAKASKGKLSASVKSLVMKARKEFIKNMDDNFSSAEAMAVIFNFSRDVNKLIDSGKQSDKDLREIMNFFREVNEIFGILTREVNTDVPQKIIDLVHKREELRKQKKFKEADSIRDDLKEMGYEIQDTPNGVIAKRI